MFFSEYGGTVFLYNCRWVRLPLWTMVMWGQDIHVAVRRTNILSQSCILLFSQNQGISIFLTFLYSFYTYQNTSIQLRLIAKQNFALKWYFFIKKSKCWSTWIWYIFFPIDSRRKRSRFLHDCSYVHNNVSIRCLMAKAYSEHNIRIISAGI